VPTIRAVRSFGVADAGTFPYDKFVSYNTDEVAGGAALVSAITSASAGDVIAVAPGRYKVATTPTWKTGVTLAAYGGAGFAPVIIDGSIKLTSWTFASGRYYASATFWPRDSTMRDGTYSVCEVSAVDGTNLCWDRDQVWLNGARMIRVASLAAGDAGVGNRFFCDRTSSRVYIWNDPAGQTIEINRAAYFVQDANVNDVTFRRITVERFASPLQRSGVSVAGDNWEFDRCIFQNNHASGLHAANVENLHVHDCQFLYNGQMGMTVAGQSSGTVYSNNIIEYSDFIGNNQEDFYIGDWEAGAFKTTSESGGIVRHCTFLDNKGLDMWVDFGSQWTFEYNTSNNAWGQAVRLEVANNCIVRYNTISGSGYDIGPHYRAAHSNWNTVFDTCAVSISECQYAEVYGNTVDTSCKNGIIVIVRTRQTTHHIFVHDNTVTQRQAPIRTGVSLGTTGTMVAAGVAMLSSSQPASEIFDNAVSWSMPGGSGETATEMVSVRDNIYYVGDLNTTARFTHINGAGTGTTYMTANAYGGGTKNPQDAGAIAV